MIFLFFAEQRCRNHLEFGKLSPIRVAAPSPTKMSNLPKQNQRVLLAAVIDGALKESDMRIETVPFDPETAELKEGQVLVANNYVSVDPVTVGSLRLSLRWTISR